MSQCLGRCKPMLQQLFYPRFPPKTAQKPQGLGPEDVSQGPRPSLPLTWLRSGPAKLQQVAHFKKPPVVVKGLVGLQGNLQEIAPKTCFPAEGPVAQPSVLGCSTNVVKMEVRV